MADAKHLVPPNEDRIRRAIARQSLFFICGAGLSMAPPSKLPSAADLSRACFDRWQAAIDPDVPAAYRHDLGGLATHIHRQGRFATFLDVVPWTEFGGESNAGHAAIADLLTCRVACGAISANYDQLV